MRKMEGLFIALLFALTGLFCLPAQAQSTFGSIIGTAQDQTGAVVPGVDIEITNLDSNARRNTSSGENGQYSLLNLPAGRYALIAMKAGFSPVRVDQIALDARQQRRIDLVVQIAAGAETVQVEAVAQAINTENGTISSTITNQMVIQLPVNYRGGSTSPLAAIVSMPNVQQDSTGQISVAGSSPSATRFSIDGTNNNMQIRPNGSSAAGTNANMTGANQNNYPSAESLDEFKISAVGNNAEFAGTGDVAVTTKSGTNMFHGSLFEYHQNRALDARTYGSPTKQAKVWNTFGGSLSGPLFRNKTFFFADYEGNRKPGSQLITASLPTVAMRAGNLSGLPGGAAVDPNTGQPFPNNQIPADRINPVAKKFLDLYYPLPNFPSTSTANNYRLQVSAPASTNGFDVRIDHNFGSRHQVYGRLSWKNIDYVQTNGLLPTESVPESNRNLTLADNYSLTPTLLNEFRFGLTRVTYDAANFPLKGTDVISALGITGLDLSQIQGAAGPFPGIDFSDGTGFTSVGHGKESPWQSRTTQFIDNLSWLKGKHTMKFGADIWIDGFVGPDTFGNGDDTGVYTFNTRTFSGNAFVDFLLGTPTQNFVFTSPLKIDEKATRYSFYAQDEYRVSNSLTLNFGLRYAILPSVVAPDGDINTFLLDPPGVGTIVIPPNHLPLPVGFLYSFNVCPGPYAPGWQGPGFKTVQPCTPISTAYGKRAMTIDWNDYQPRFSLAWRPFGNNKTVFRGGLGLFTVIKPSGTGFNYSGNIASTITYANFTGAGIPPQYTWPQAFSGTGLSPQQIGQATYNGLDTKIKNAQTTQWNVTLERELAANWTLHLNYFGSNTSGLTVGIDPNQVLPSTQPYNRLNAPYPGPYLNFFAVTLKTNLGFANYQAFNPSIEHRFSNGLMLRTDYTWAKSISDANGDSNAYGQINNSQRTADWHNMRYYRGNDPATRHHRLLLTSVYQLPIGRGRSFLANANGIVNGILGGWQLSTITMIQTGPYLTPTISAALSQSNTNEVGRRVTIRPDRIADGNFDSPTPAAWWNIDAFVPTPAGAGRVGNAGAGILKGPGTVAVAGGLSKTFQLKEKARLRFETTFTNLPNHPNFAAPPTVVSNRTTFGKVVTVQSAENAGNRVGQVSLRLEF